jgi:hypothetical protein
LSADARRFADVLTDLLDVRHVLLLCGGIADGGHDQDDRAEFNEPTRDVTLNRTSRGGTDAVLFASQPFTKGWSGAVLAGGYWQQRNDIDGDGWADLAGYSRAVIRPRVFWSDNAGRSVFATGGGMWEQRNGGTMPSAMLPATGEPYPESVDTARVDGGLSSHRLPWPIDMS